MSDDLDLVGFAIIAEFTSPIIGLVNSVFNLPNGQVKFSGGGGRGVPPYMGYIGMCCCEGYGFQAVYSRIGHINQSIWI